MTIAKIILIVLGAIVVLNGLLLVWALWWYDRWGREEERERERMQRDYWRKDIKRDIESPTEIKLPADFDETPTEKMK